MKMIIANDDIDTNVTPDSSDHENVNVDNNNNDID